MARIYLLARLGAPRRHAARVARGMYKTIKVTVKVNVNGVTYEKDWKLLTFQEVFNSALGVYLKKKLTDRFWKIEKEKHFGEYPLKPHAPNVTHENFVEYASWVSLRARAPFAMPCCICGSNKPFFFFGGAGITYDIYVKHLTTT